MKNRKRKRILNAISKPPRTNNSPSAKEVLLVNQSAPAIRTNVYTARALIIITKLTSAGKSSLETNVLDKRIQKPPKKNPRLSRPGGKTEESSKKIIDIIATKKAAARDKYSKALKDKIKSAKNICYSM